MNITNTLIVRALLIDSEYEFPGSLIFMLLEVRVDESEELGARFLVRSCGGEVNSREERRP